jgi:hypothetical protein
VRESARAVRAGVGSLEVTRRFGFVHVEGVPSGLEHRRRSPPGQQQETLHDELFGVGAPRRDRRSPRQGEMKFDDGRDLVAGPLLHGDRNHEHAAN